MHRVISATTNPAKIQAILQALKRFSAKDRCHARRRRKRRTRLAFGSEETCWAYEIAWVMRDATIHKLISWVAIEAGIDDDATFSWVVIDNGVQRGEARRPRCRCPPSFSAESAGRSAWR